MRQVTSALVAATIAAGSIIVSSAGFAQSKNSEDINSAKSSPEQATYPSAKGDKPGRVRSTGTKNQPGGSGTTGAGGTHGDGGDQNIGGDDGGGGSGGSGD